MMKKLNASILGAVLGLMLLPSPQGSLAAEDGGTRSVFAYGAGNRALAMGGAFVAVADDASAPLWNPGGLALVPRRGVQASRSTLYNLRIAEEYAALVMPSWRFGVAALTFRHLGVDGIEGRDDRNVVTDDDLAADETQISLSYGRRFGEAWSLGASLKLQRQSLAGLSASGVGADVGLLVRPGTALGFQSSWAQRVSLGVSLENVIEPTLRLNEDSVSDPLTLKVGTAYRHPISLGGYLLLAVDLEHSRDIDPRLHGGMELQLHPLVSLRTGLNHGTPAVGAGLRWKDVALDYVLEDNDLGSVHRFGVSLDFGSSMEESQRAAFRAQEEALQERLQQAFERRQAERVESLMKEATAAHDDGRFDDALEVLAVLNTLTPGLPRAQFLEASSWRAKGQALEKEDRFSEAALSYGRALTAMPEDTTAARGAERCREESDRVAARSSELRQQFADALDAFSSGDLVRAKNGFSEILTQDANDQEVQDMLARVERAIDRRVEELLEQADRFIDGGLLDSASGLVEKARRLDPGGVAAVQSRLLRARDRRPARVEQETRQRDGSQTAQIAPSETSPAELTARERREAESLYQKGVEAMKEDRIQDALRYWELVLSIDPQHTQARSHLKQEYLMRGMDSFAAGNLDEAVTYWEKALTLDPSDEKARGYLERARQQLSRTREILGESR
jgi:tetratricopeptide (TPR) repeat protein